MAIVGPASAQGIDPNASEAAAKAALSVLSVAATPSETMSSFSFLSASGDTRDFRSTQLRGGDNPNDTGLYLEGLVAYQRYNPVFIFPDIAPDTELDVTWASVAGTIGVGWDFPIGRGWVIRPTGHASLGHVTGDALLVDGPFASRQSDGVDAVDRSLNAFGAGASVTFVREAEYGAWTAEYRLRQTYMEFYPFNEANVGDAKATSNQTSGFARHRYSLKNLKLFDQDTRLVLDAGVVFYHGDEAKVLKTDWIATAGVGLEVDTSQTGLPYVTAGRVMLNAVVGEDFDGFSVGLGLRF